MRSISLTLATEEYIIRRRSEGSPFLSSEATLRAFCRWCGAISLKELTSEHVASFISKPSNTQATRVSKFSAVKGFIEDCVRIGEMSYLDLPKPSRPFERRVPFIFSQAHMRTLLVTAAKQGSGTGATGYSPLWLALLLLYATGAAVGEILSLRVGDVKLTEGRISFRESQVRAKREIPIGPSLRSQLSVHLRDRLPREWLLHAPSGGPASRKVLNRQFRKVLLACEAVGQGSPRPRMQDLRYTFAVHRLRSWIGQGRNVDELVPALSVYMGYADLLKAEQFLAYTPEFFQAEVLKLSSKTDYAPDQRG